MKRLYKEVKEGWELIEEGAEIVVPTEEGNYRIEELVEGGSTIIFETQTFYDK